MPLFKASASMTGLFTGVQQRAFTSSNDKSEHKISKEEIKEEEVEATIEQKNHKEKETTMHKMQDSKETKAMDKMHGTEGTKTIDKMKGTEGAKAMEGKQELRGQANGMLKTKHDDKPIDIEKKSQEEESKTGRNGEAGKVEAQSAKQTAEESKNGRE